MDQRSNVDHSPASPALNKGLPSPGRAATTSVSAAIAEANAHLTPLTQPDVPYHEEYGSHSLAEMAAKDLDATLQLLAERAQYITAASGAAIALRRGEHSDMLCRASAGSNAPELGALLSMEYGLSGESVRTGQTLHCEDAENDPRVNREGCRQLGIASVIVMPIMSEQNVLGVFELFSGKPGTFQQRDILALQRLSGMVETAVKHAVTAQAVQREEKSSQQDTEHFSANPVTVEAVADPAQSDDNEEMLQPAENLLENVSVAKALPENKLAVADLATVDKSEPEPEIEIALAAAVTQTAQSKTVVLDDSKPEPAKKLFFWSAAAQTPPAVPLQGASIDSSPPLRTLQKCQACGFPVSQGRTLCVECEQKQWRGEAVVASGGKPSPAAATVQPAATAVAPEKESSALIEAEPVAEHSPALSPAIPAESTELAATDTSTLFLSSAAPAESWFAANKYILVSLLVVAIIIAAVVWMR